MSLEQYKKKAMDYLKKTYPTSTAMQDSLTRVSDKEWREYMKDFSPETAVQGMVSGLI